MTWNSPGTGTAVVWLLGAAVGAASAAPPLVEFSVASAWSGGFTGQVRIENRGSTKIDGWVLSWAGGPSFSEGWNAQFARSGDTIVATDAGWNRLIRPGKSVQFGFTATGQLEESVSSCQLNAAAVEVTYIGAVAAPAPSAPVEPAPAPAPAPEPAPAPAPAPAPSEPTANSASLRTAVSIDSQWSSGFTATISITNSGSSVVEHWTIDWPHGPAISSLWNGVLTQSGSTLHIADAGWNATIAPGGSVAVGFVGGGSWTSSMAASITVAATAVPAPTPVAPVAPVAPTPSSPASGGETTPTVEPTPNPNESAPPSGTSVVQYAAPRWPERFFAPYADVTLWPPVDLVEAAATGPAKFFTTAFVVASQGSACDGAWGGYSSYTPESLFLAAQIDGLRAQGGDVMVSFGGAAGTELAGACASAMDTALAYQEIIDAYQLTHIDFDIEGYWVADVRSRERRSEAIRLLQDWARRDGRELVVWYTLPVLPQGLTADGLAVVRSALQWGVDLAGVNLMAMDYGASAAPPASATMGQYAIAAAESTSTQLASLLTSVGRTPSESKLWAMIGLTPMIGQNDVPGEVFTLADAALLRDYANARGLGMLSMWSLTRDEACPGGTSRWASPSCSGVLQAAGEFACTLGGTCNP